MKYNHIGIIVTKYPRRAGVFCYYQFYLVVGRAVAMTAEFTAGGASFQRTGLVDG